MQFGSDHAAACYDLYGVKDWSACLVAQQSGTALGEA